MTQNTGRAAYTWTGMYRNIDLSPMCHVTMCCDHCKTYWAGQAPQYCPSCGLVADEYRDRLGVIKPSNAYSVAD